MTQASIRHDGESADSSERAAERATGSGKVRRVRRRGEWGSVALAAVLLVLLAVLAVLQHHWLGRASEADRQRTSASLQSAAQRFGADFNRELTDLLSQMMPGMMHGAGADEVVAAVARWRERTQWPELVRGIWRLHMDDDGAEIQPLDAGSDEVPEPLLRLGERLRRRDMDLGTEERNPLFVHPRVLMGDVPALLLPEHAAFFRRRRGGEHRGGRSGERRHPPRHFDRQGDRQGEPGPPDYWLVYLDQTVIREHILPELAERHFFTEPGLRLRVVDLVGTEIWRSAAGDAPLESVEPVASSELFGPLRPPGGFVGGRRPPGPFAPAYDVLAAAAGVDHGQWRLLVLHPAGSLDAAVARARHRSLALSGFILLVLAVSVVLLTQGALRARTLARRQLEFVAGVTHELKTPLAALRSAGQNLADGVVKPERVKTYGQLVDREGKRLEDTVAQILAYAGMENGRELRARALDPAQAARAAVGDLRPVLDEAGVDVELSAGDDLPSVSAEPEALGRALRNLVHNAALHGQAPDRGEQRGWVGLDVEAGDGEVRFHVRDRGPGIDPSDRKRIFEPFVRGRGLAASNLPGSGLGLALVRQVADAHGGSVNVSLDDDRTTFTLKLPSVGSHETGVRKQ